jgi:eukaryotic-like serine/threonine-protein kinase
MQSRHLLYNRYRIQKSISTGNFRETYLAVDEVLGYSNDSKIVVKQFKPLSKDPEILKLAKELFEKEAKILKGLGQTTDRTPKLYDRFEEEGGFYLIQEFIDGRSLDEELGGAQLSEVQTFKILQEILTGLAEIHSNNVIHQDLKPENIIRRSSNNKLVFVDFGAIKAIRKPIKIQISKSIGVGSLGYTAREQSIGKPEFSSDIYAVGAIGIQCLTGRHPADLLDNNTSELKWLHLCQPSDRAVQILSKMVSVDHLDRYRDATEARQEIDRFLIDSIVSNAPPPQSSNNLPINNRSARKDRSPVNATPFIQQRRSIKPSISPREGSANESPVIIDRRKAIKWLGFIGIGAMGISFIPQLLKGLFDRDRSSKLLPPKSPSSQLSKIEFTSVKLNDKGDIISRPKGFAQIYREDLGNGVSISMVKVPAGKFMMGSPESEKDRVENESPQHRVTLKEFYMGQTEITQSQYQAIMGDNPAKFKGNNRPVERVDWNQAKEFCRRLSIKTGKTYTLPSESQWEYACRAGTTTPFTFGATITSNVANYEGNYNGKESYRNEPKGVNRATTTDVMTFPPNAFGLYDMHGNVWEWCADTWSDDYEEAPTDGSVWLDESPNMVLRGGAWSERPEICRSTSRIGNLPEIRVDAFGFRVVCATSPKVAQVNRKL